MEVEVGEGERKRVRKDGNYAIPIHGEGKRR